MAFGFGSKAVSDVERIVKRDLNQGTSSHFMKRVWALQIICCWCCCKNKAVVMIGGVCSRLVIGQPSWKCRAGGGLLPNYSNQCLGIQIQPKPRPAAPGEQFVLSLPIRRAGHVLKQATVSYHGCFLEREDTVSTFTFLHPGSPGQLAKLFFSKML